MFKTSYEFFALPCVDSDVIERMLILMGQALLQVNGSGKRSESEQIRGKRQQACQF